MKKVQLFSIKGPRDEYTLVSNEDYDWVNRHKWFVSTPGYAYRYTDKHTKIMLHHLIAPAPEGMVRDHINGNTLDNRRENLRVCTRAQNNRNVGLSRNNKSGYKGVCFFKRDKTWQAYIDFNGRKHLGYFKTARQAAEVYNRAAKELHGDFARLNAV